MRSLTWRSEITSPHTGMYGRVGSFDSPRPWLMIERRLSAVSVRPALVSAGTYGETPPRPCSPWHWAQPNWTKSCAPGATCGFTGAETTVAVDDVCVCLVL